MFNAQNYNAVNFNNRRVPIAVVSAQDDIVFNDFSLQDSDVITSRLLHDSPPRRDFLTAKIPRADGRFSVGDFWNQKTITMRGIITKTTASLLEAKLTALKKALAVAESNLDIKVDGVIRRYVATWVNSRRAFERRESYDITKVPFDFEFACLEPFGQAVGYSADEFIGKTSLALSITSDNDGNIHAKASIGMIFNAVNSVSVVNIVNNTTGEEIEITRAFSAGEYLKIDGEERSVEVNGTAVDYTGIFPTMNTGANSFTITITATSVTYDLTIKHRTPYL